MLLTYKTILAKKSQLNSSTHLYHFNLLEPKEIIFTPGQYMILKVPSDKGPVSRLYSIASSNTVKNSFDLIIEMIPGGLATNYLLSLKENTEIIFQGPAGIFKLRENNKNKIFLVTGTGIAPIRSILISNIKNQISKTQIKNQKLILFWGLKYYQDIYLFNELKQWNNEIMKQFSFKICLSREENLNMVPEADKKYFQLGHIDSCFLKQLNPTLPFGLRGTSNETMKQLNNFDFYLCGGRNIVESLKQFLLSKNVPQENIIFEKF